jgi:hypothetical protein
MLSVANLPIEHLVCHIFISDENIKERQCLSGSLCCNLICVALTVVLLSFGLSLQI